MSEQDEYNPTASKKEYGSKGTFNATQNAFRKGRTESEERLDSILGGMGVRYLAQEVVRTPFFDGMGRPQSYLLDCLLVDSRYDQGVIHVDGRIHSHAKKERKDAADYRHMTLATARPYMERTDLMRIRQVAGYRSWLSQRKGKK